MALPQRRTSQPAQDWHSLYEIENPTDVETYVAEHPSVAAILEEAPGQIREVFGNQVPPRLRLNWDPEVGDAWLVVGIPSADIGPSVLPLIDAFDERWWLDRATTTDATVVIDVERL